MSTISCLSRIAKHELNRERIKHGVLELLNYVLVPQRLKLEEPLLFVWSFLSLLAGNSLIVMIVNKTPNLRKPINYFIANMASSDLLYPIFTCPWSLLLLHTSRIIGVQFGQALCKL